MEKWRFLYTKHSNLKKAVTKTNALKEGRLSMAAFVVTEGKDYAACLLAAQNECKFGEHQLIGSRKVQP
jgi:hypothetical protein